MEIIKEHDILVKEILNEFALTNKKNVTNAFLYSLTSTNLVYRAGLSVFAVLQKFPNHTFVLNTHKDDKPENDPFYKICKICGTNERQSDNLDSIIGSMKIGGIIGKDLINYFFYLKEFNKLNQATPSERDFNLFKEILNSIINIDENATPNVLLKSIRRSKIIKGDESEIQCLLETLGYCGILETEQHKGFLNHYISLGHAPRKTHNSDWNYPVGFWTGKDGINKKALKHWFGEYEELNEFIL